MWLVNCLLTLFVGPCLWRLRSWCRCRLVLVVSRIGFSIPVGIRSSLILFVWHLFLVASWSSIFSFPSLRPVLCCSYLVCGHFQCWLGWWLLRLWRCLACLLGYSQCRSSLHRLGFSTSISSLLSRGTDFVLTWCCPFYQGVSSFFSQSELKFARCRFHRVYSFPYLSIEASHHYRVVVWFP